MGRNLCATPADARSAGGDAGAPFGYSAAVSSFSGFAIHSRPRSIACQ